MTTSTNHRASKTIHKSNHKRHRSTSSLQQQSSSSPNKHLILFCKILLVLIILLLLPQLVESKNRKKKRERRLVNKIYNEKRIHCQHSQGHEQQQQGDGLVRLGAEMMVPYRLDTGAARSILPRPFLLELQTREAVSISHLKKPVYFELGDGRKVAVR